MPGSLLSSSQPHQSGEKPPSGFLRVVIALLGLGFILTAIFQMRQLGDRSHHYFFFQYLPEAIIHFRYLIAWCASVFGVVAGIGLFRHKEFSRRVAIILSCVSISGTFGKYSPEGFVQYLGLLSEEMASRGEPFSPASIIQFAQAWNIAWLSEFALAWGCIVFLMALEILLAIAIIFFLTQPSVKVLFQRRVL